MSSFTDFRVWPLKDQTKAIKANADVLVKDTVRVRFVIRQGPRGLFAALPSREYEHNGEKKYSRLVSIEDSELYQEFQELAMAAYAAEVPAPGTNSGEGNQDTDNDDIPF
jgi:DNA-binding cell septation regulator SpoVG